MTNFNPMNEVMLTAALGLFSKVSNFMSALVGMIFIMRITLLVIQVASARDYADVLSDTVKYLGITSLFPYLIRLIVDITSSLALKVSFVPLSEEQKSVQDFIHNLLGEYPLFQIFGSIGDLILNLFAQSIYTVLISLLLAIAPIVIFTSIMLNFTESVGAYFQTLIALCLWPILWNILGLLGRELFPLINDSPVSGVVFWIVVQFLQLFSPIFCFLLFKSLSPSQSLGHVSNFLR